MRFDWDDSKSKILKQTRGYTLQEVANIFRNDYVERIKNDAPEQFIAIAYLGNILVSVIYEIRYDEEGEYIWLITYWKSTKKERQIYEQYFY
ncbi:hypothetical protein [Geminocystis sp. GBBB08]|uniref:BrnT family toxin n=1 Tax=Geminocystis sp. GBBB08 TaxID=2604140 RepID=UPI0027E3A53F|nr:hypothetical protein [Geminocystis sp. GBBB08]MBL1208330.1 hypothetical protein [Geminocystis sp. GBBB08]